MYTLLAKMLRVYIYTVPTVMGCIIIIIIIVTNLYKAPIFLPWQDQSCNSAQRRTPVKKKNRNNK